MEVGMKNYDRIISLGGSCQTAHQIKRNFPHIYKANIFDWLGIYNPNAMIRLIEEGVEKIGKFENLTVRPGSKESDKYWYIIDREYGVGFAHHFPRSLPYEESFLAFRSKIDFLAARWNTVLGGTEKILFVRRDARPVPGLDYDWRSAFRGDYLGRLDEVICNKYPSLDYHILFVTPYDDLKLRMGSPRISMGCTASIGGWEGDNEGWAELLSKYSDSVPVIGYEKIDGA